MKQEGRNRLSFLKYGIPDDVIVKLLAHNYTVSKLCHNSLSKDLQKKIKYPLECIKNALFNDYFIIF